MYRSCSQQFAHLKLNSSKVMNLLNDYLDDFETKLEWNQFDQVDMQVPRLIIAKFKRLLQLWKDNETFSKYLKIDLLEDIHSLMIEVLNEYDFRRSTHSPLTDDSQDDPHVDSGSDINYNAIANNIVDHSYALQITSFDESNSTLLDHSKNTISEQGIHIAKRNDKGTYFRCFLCRVSIPVDEENGLSCFDDLITSHEQQDEHQFNLLVFQAHQRYIKIHNRNEDSFQCTLCGEIFHLHLLMEHFANSQHTRRKMISECESNSQNSISNNLRIEFVVQIISDKGIFTKCHLCRTTIPIATSIPTSTPVRSYFEDVLDTHKRNEIHQFNLTVFYTHQPYIKTNNEEDDSYICTLCNQILYLDSLMNHFTNSNHTKLKLLSTCNMDVENFNELRINFIDQVASDEGNLTKCHLCQTTICTGSSNTADRSCIDIIEAHERSVDHRFNFLLYKSHEQFFRVINESKNFFQCNLCSQVFFLGSLMRHFTNFNHSKMKLLSICGM